MFAIHVNLLQPKPSLFFSYGLLLSLMFSVLENNYFHVSFNVKVSCTRLKIPWSSSCLKVSTIASCHLSPYDQRELTYCDSSSPFLVNLLYWSTKVVDGESLLPLDATLIFRSVSPVTLIPFTELIPLETDKQTSFSGLDGFYPQSWTKSLGLLGNARIYLCFPTVVWKNADKKVIQKRFLLPLPHLIQNSLEIDLWVGTGEAVFARLLFWRECKGAQVQIGLYFVQDCGLCMVNSSLANCFNLTPG